MLSRVGILFASAANRHGHLSHKSLLIQPMAWCRLRNQPLRRPMTFKDICECVYGTWPKWHDDVITWKRFPHEWTLWRESTGRHSLKKGQWCGALLFHKLPAYTKCWTSNQVVGDWRPHGAHDVTAIISQWLCRLYSVSLMQPWLQLDHRCPRRPNDT